MGAKRKRVRAARGDSGGTNLCRMGLGVVAGGLMFVGQAAPARAGTVLEESFESSPSPLFSAFNSYAYSQNYTSVNTPPLGGLRYYTGDLAAAQTTKVAVVDVTGASGAPAAVIDAGLANFNLSAWFSTYLNQNDWSSVSVQFKDAGAGNVGSAVQIGGEAFIVGLGTAPNGDGLPDYRDFEQDSTSGTVPAGARSAEVTIFTQRFAGTAADGYLDLVRLDVTQVPEPGAALAAFAAVSLLRLRRPRRA